MTLLKTILEAPEDAPKLVIPEPQKVVSGNPEFKVWRQDDDRNGAIRTGIWEATPGAFTIAKGQNYEYCHILKGMLELSEDGEKPVVYKAGDSFVMKPGFSGVWKTILTVRKIFVITD
ncbi:cupin domain-containing protein [Neorhizobium sp. NCHU2750]|uniref:cupin domain-containing protein n=1 Tax=Neorhizobium sp. NCHU2750 TaxID=1825976 RepID=UPI000E715946|nr:cupin [Neorhizobium sp. NCHU2750]